MANQRVRLPHIDCRRVALLCIVSVFLAGCYTGYGRAVSYGELIKIGMSQGEVRDIVGEPEAVSDVKHGDKTDVPLAGPDSDGVVEWHYVWNTPLTTWIIPTVMFFTIVLTYPAICLLYGVGRTRQGHLHVDFGSDGKVLRIWVDLVGF